MGVAPQAIDDVLQDTFLIVHRKLPEFSGPHIRAWLSRILHNTIREHRRRYRRKEDKLGEEIDVAHHDTPEHAAIRSQATQQLLAILSELDDDQRAVFVLTELEEMSAPEISEALEVPLNTVYSRLRLARLKFSKAVSHHQASRNQQTTLSASVAKGSL